MLDTFNFMDLKKEIICAEAIHLSHEDKIHVLKMIKRYDPQLLNRFPDGTRILLNKLPDTMNQAIYDYINHKLNIESCN